MKVLVVQNYADTGLGQVATALAEANADVTSVMAYDGDALPPTPEGFDAIVVLGGAQTALDDEGSPWLLPLAALMREFADSDRAVLGICLGSQLMARAYGADNLIGAAPEFGWQHVSVTPEGAADPVLSVAGGTFPIFQWHDDTFTLPRGAVRLAGNAAAHNQAFRIGRAGYAMQFHFEADRALLDEWSVTFADTLAARQPGWGERRMADAEAFGKGADAAGLAIARAWVSTIRPAP
ncbi:MAG: type 1 glutamine amidotransferase [Mesorhizobium sp.]